MNEVNTADEKAVPRWKDYSDKEWPIEVVPAWAYDGLKKAYDRVVEQLNAELKWRRENSND